MDASFKPLFWDCDFDKIDPVANAGFVIRRILAKGDIPQYRWAEKTYGADKIKDVLTADRELDNKSLNFWCKYFNLNEKLCTQKQSAQRPGLFWTR